jgi:LmbE family N-acetylglucosaminyl deacetylase
MSLPTFVNVLPKKLQRLLKFKSGYAPYRFIVDSWKKVGDLDVASRLLDTQLFERNLVAAPLPLKQMRSILVLAPHQDDEAIGAGGTLMLAQKAGVERHVMFITDGRPRKMTRNGTTPEEVVEIRRREAAGVCRQLGASMHCLNINNVAMNPSLTDLDHLSDIISQIAPQVILLPWLLDTPKHRIASHLLWLCHLRRPLPLCEIWGYQVHNTLLPNGYIDITDVADEKLKLIRRYDSQIKYVRRYDHMTMGMNAWNCRFLPDYKADLAERYIEIFCALPLLSHLKLVESFYLPDLQAIYRGMNVYKGMLRIHKEVTSSRPH